MNALGNPAQPPYYVWADADCANKSIDFNEALQMRDTLVRQARANVYIVDCEGNEVAPPDEICSSAPVANEALPGAISEEILSISMVDIVGPYEDPVLVPECQWVERVSSFAHKDNGKAGVWEFVLNLSVEFTDVPPKLRPVISKARSNAISYLIIHQGT